MPTENERRVGEFATGSKSLFDEWTANMAGFAQKLDNGSLTVDDLVKTWAANTRLGLKGWDIAYSMFGGPQAKSAPGADQASTTATSAFFPVQLIPAVAGKLELTLLGPLKADVGGHQIPVGEIHFLPPVLGENERAFRLEFAKGTHPKLIYRGKVEVRTAAGQPVLKTIDVSVEVK